MNHTVNWKNLIDRFHSKLSSWKANLLSIGGHLTLIKSVLGSLRIYYFSIFKVPETILKSIESLRALFFRGVSQDTKKLAWIKWSNVMASFDKGGLGIGSLKSFNLALLQKWRWRLASNPSALWVCIIKALHGHEGGFDQRGCKINGLWAKIVGSSNHLHSSGIFPTDSLRFKVGCATLIRFWKDTWPGDHPLYLRYNRLFRLERNKDCLVIDRISNEELCWDWSRSELGTRNISSLNALLVEIGNIEVTLESNACVWSLAKDAMFSVGVTRQFLDDRFLPSLVPSTIWEKMLPRKVNITPRVF
ncbi:hypothetical protein Tco_1567832, partial [Tanacetum coccineum]